MDDISTDEVIAEQPVSPNQGESLLEIESMILRFISDMEKLRGDIREQNDMFKSSYESDSTYSQKKEEADKIKKEVTATKQVLVKSPAAAHAEGKVKELKDELKGMQETLTTLLKQRQKLTENPQILRDNGEVYEVKTKISLVKQNTKRNP